MPDRNAPRPPGGPAPSRLEVLAQVRDLCRLTGTQVRVLPHDEVVRLSTSDEVCSLLIRRVHAREYKYQTVFTGADLILFSWMKLGPTWSKQEPVVMPDAAFVPYRRQEVGEVRDTMPKLKERLEWEALCHRPGNGTRLGQRDSFVRAYGGEGDDLFGASTESPMKRSWAQHEATLFSSSTGDE